MRIFASLISLTFIGEIKSVWSSDCIHNKTANLINCKSEHNIISIIQAKVCDGHQDCFNGKDESPTYCGTGCQIAYKGNSKFINCGKRQILVLYAINVINMSLSALNNGINVTNSFRKCDGTTTCDLKFTKEAENYVIVEFKCLDHKVNRTARPHHSNIMTTSRSQPFITGKHIDTSSTERMISGAKGNNIPAIVAGIICGVLVIGLFIICLVARRLLARAKLKRKTKDAEEMRAENMNYDPDLRKQTDKERSIPPLSQSFKSSYSSVNRVSTPQIDVEGLNNTEMFPNANMDNDDIIIVKQTNPDMYDHLGNVAQQKGNINAYDHFSGNQNDDGYDVSSQQMKGRYNTCNNSEYNVE